MYGIVNKSIQELITHKFGIDVWAKIKVKSNIDIDYFLSNEPYDDEITYSLASAASEVLNVSVDEIIDGAQKATLHAQKHRLNPSELALVVSCIGRKIVLNQRVEEEIEEVKSILGNDTKISGFYSYGEIAPYPNQTGCELHNQTMTLTLISE
jgi:hypothetical protein